jgi:hypothetical protein
MTDLVDLMKPATDKAERLKQENAALRRQKEAYRMALANALGFLRAHAIGYSYDGLAVRRQIQKTLRRAA